MYLMNKTMSGDPKISYIVEPYAQANTFLKKASSLRE